MEARVSARLHGRSSKLGRAVSSGLVAPTPSTPTPPPSTPSPLPAVATFVASKWREETLGDEAYFFFRSGKIPGGGRRGFYPSGFTGFGGGLSGV